MAVRRLPALETKATHRSCASKWSETRSHWAYSSADSERPSQRHAPAPSPPREGSCQPSVQVRLTASVLQAGARLRAIGDPGPCGWMAVCGRARFATRRRPRPPGPPRPQLSSMRRVAVCAGARRRAGPSGPAASAARGGGGGGARRLGRIAYPGEDAAARRRRRPHPRLRRPLRAAPGVSRARRGAERERACGTDKEERTGGGGGRWRGQGRRDGPAAARRRRAPRSPVAAASQHN